MKYTKAILYLSFLFTFINCTDTNKSPTEEEEITTDPIDPTDDILTLTVTEVGTLPEAVSNNAVTEGFIGRTPYLFSFGGIDNTKLNSGIHLRSYRYNINTNTAEQIPDLPDTMGKIAAAASRIDNIIYISGGYYVFPDTSETSSNKMHRYDIENNVFLTDGTDIPVATDDHVQAVWRNKLIYLITGWSNTANIPDVQIYDPIENIWLTGTSVPEDDYRSFGASGTIIGDTIYYFGGATSNQGFGIQNQLRIGKINPENPTDITWSIQTPNTNINGYRMAATSINGRLHWLGGSTNTYNYNGVAYNSGQGVPPAGRDLYTATDVIQWNTIINPAIPMDLRGVGSTDETTKYLIGGMSSNQTVSNKVYRLNWNR